jgi:transcription elongation factor Elf1
MPSGLANTIACPRCHRLGTICHETVIHAADSSIAFSCSVCGHEWNAHEPSLPPAKIARPPKKPARH